MNSKNKKVFKKTADLVLNILLPVLALGILAAIVYALVVYDSRISDFFNSPMKLTMAIALLVFLSVLVVAINEMNGFRKPENVIKGSFAPDQPVGAAKDDVDESENDSKSRFSKLIAVDEKMAEYRKPRYDDDITLEQLCEGFRNYAASKHGLYYDITTVRSFIAGLAVNKLIIMQGISGTGKTSMAWAFGEYVGHSSSIIPVQPSWKEKTDLLGYFNEFTHHFNETEFLKVLYEAGYTDDVCVTVLDEMNIARVEYYFAEFLSLLELRQTDNWLIDVVSSSSPTDPERIVEGRLKLPVNMWYIGTANNDDSTMAISDKVYDRAMVIDLNRRALPFEAPQTDGIRLSYSRFTELVKAAGNSCELSAEGRRKINELDEYMTSNLGIAFGNRIMRQLEAFVPVFISCGGTESEAIDIIMARKVLRKLEAKNPLFVQRQREAFERCIDEVFDTGEMSFCREVLSKYNI